MKKVTDKYIDTLVKKFIKENINERADDIMSQINELGGMEDSHPTFGKMNLAKDLQNMSDEEIDALLRKPINHDDEDEGDEEWGETDRGEEELQDLIEEARDFLENECGYEIEELNSMSEDDIVEALFDEGNIELAKKIDKLLDFDGLDDEDDRTMRGRFFDDEEEDVDMEFENELSEDDCMECGEKLYEIEFTRESEVCECGSSSMVSEGMCMECGLPKMEEGIYDIEDLNNDNDWDYIEEEDDVDFMDDEMEPKYRKDDDSEKDSENSEFCKYQKKMFGRNDERYKEKCTGKSAIKDLASMEINLNEKLHGGQRKIDRNHNGKIDAEDFKMLRKSKGKMKVTESVTLRESELITLIENIILEKESRGLKTMAKPKGMSEYERAFKGSGKENKDYLESVVKKMKDYLKDGHEGDFEMNPKDFPMGNRQLKEKKIKGFNNSKEGEEYIDDYLRPGMENLSYDEIHPNDEWMEDIIGGSSRTGNSDEYANSVKTDVNKKLVKKRKENKLDILAKKGGK